MAEETIYADNNVSVTTARVIIFGTTYALRNITSVKMTTTPPNNGCAVSLIVVGGLAVISAIPAFAQKVLAGLTSLIIGGTMIAAGIVWAQFQKPSYNVTIASSAGEIRALTSQDKDYISKIVNAINEAFVRYR